MLAPLEIHMFPCLWDNYGFLIHSPETGETACIDTPEVDKIILALEEKSWNLTHIWNTHHHPDHAGGNLKLKEIYGAKIIGCEADRKRIPGIDIGISDGDRFNFAGHEVQIMETPGHTIGHIIYYVPSAKSAFVGDTIFALGCGRLFEGTPVQMYHSLSRIAGLPDDTALYCAHEYTLSNGKFALTVEPNNQALIDYVKDATSKREENIPTVPTTVLAEKSANPFVRAGSAKRLGEIRKAKDNF
ncbi:MAG: hydroxyacylglutathione hydrolase [Hellea sp.]|nr:hydroxyacylglutathione hydrolase [Hellea sp.]